MNEQTKQPWAKETINYLFEWYGQNGVNTEINNLVQQSLPSLTKRERQSRLFFRDRLIDAIEAAHVLANS